MKTLSYTIELNELDPVGYVHHPHYFVICEKVREQLLQTHYADYASLKNKDIALVVAKIDAEYSLPLTAGPIEVAITIHSHSSKMLTLTHEMKRSGYKAFSANIVFVSVNYSTGKTCPLPSEVTSFIDAIHGAL
ncbi:acyl-CoA thioesterase [Bdellovibrio sp. HCB337]|uniref:acyl-CoA thioesterase n=1 Tax=Bdellovibrio sp. HCB337 TaxID=3394358 RepID=UPI0039A587C6